MFIWPSLAKNGHCTLWEFYWSSQNSQHFSFGDSWRQ